MMIGPGSFIAENIEGKSREEALKEIRAKVLSKREQMSSVSILLKGSASGRAGRSAGSVNITEILLRWVPETS